MTSTNQNTKAALIKMCEGEMCVKCCGDCLYMDLNDKSKYDDYYCGKKKKYYPASDSACGEFEWK